MSIRILSSSDTLNITHAFYTKKVLVSILTQPFVEVFGGCFNPER